MSVFIVLSIIVPPILMSMPESRAGCVVNRALTAPPVYFDRAAISFSCAAGESGAALVTSIRRILLFSSSSRSISSAISPKRPVRPRLIRSRRTRPTIGPNCYRRTPRSACTFSSLGMAGWLKKMPDCRRFCGGFSDRAHIRADLPAAEFDIAEYAKRNVVFKDGRVKKDFSVTNTQDSGGTTEGDAG